MKEEQGPERQEDGSDSVEAAREQAAVTVEDEAGEGEAREGVSAEVDELRAELDSLNDRHLRLAAEFDNYRRRNERERQTLAARLQVELVSAMLDVLDDLERVAETDGASAAAVVEGVRLVEKKLRSALGAAGLEEVQVEDQPFDPEVMEALMTVPTDDPGREDHVADVFQKGYRFRDVLVRPARVRVLKYEEPDE